MDFLATGPRNPFGMNPPCERFVPGYGDTTADFHVIGDHPGVHGGLATGVPFTGRSWSSDFFDALARAGLVRDVDLEAGTLDAGGTFLSYLHPCEPGEGGPDEDDYATMEPYFDAELRAITAHVLLPVGRRATRHVLANYTARPAADVDVDGAHGRELRGSGWLVVPVKSPATWASGDAERLVAGLRELARTDYRRESDLGRFLPGGDSYLVR